MDNSNKIKDYTLDNFYACLSPPPGQVEEPEQQTIIESAPQDGQIVGGKGAVRFELPKTKINKLKHRMENRHLAKQNKQALKATRDTQYREIPWADMKVALEARNGTESELSTTIAAATLASLRRSKRDKLARKDLVYVIDYNDNEMRCGVMNGTIPFAVPDSGTTSSIEHWHERGPMSKDRKAIQQGVYLAKRASSNSIRGSRVSVPSTTPSIGSPYHARSHKQLPNEY